MSHIISKVKHNFTDLGPQRPGGFGGPNRPGRPGGFGPGRPEGPGGPGGQRPKCSDGGRATCTCANGNVIDRPRPNPCGDNTRPTCVCSDGSSPSPPSSTNPSAGPNSGNSAETKTLSIRQSWTQEPNGYER